MAIEKAFAIEALPEAIWEALWRELSSQQGPHFEVEKSTWPRSLVLKVDLAGISTRISYSIEWRGGQSEVSARLEPLSSRYWLLQWLTLGRLRTNYELMLVQGLSNLKQAVEGQAAGQ